MTRALVTGALLCAVLSIAMPSIDKAHGAAQDWDLPQYRGRSRVLLVFAPNNDDPALIRQRCIVANAEAGFQDRDLVFVEVIGRDAITSNLRHHFDVPVERFRGVLIGKDGGIKFESSAPLSAQLLFTKIDAMPMRRHEIQQKPTPASAPPLRRLTSGCVG